MPLLPLQLQLLLLLLPQPLLPPSLFHGDPKRVTPLALPLPLATAAAAAAAAAAAVAVSWRPQTCYTIGAAATAALLSPLVFSHAVLITEVVLIPRSVVSSC